MDLQEQARIFCKQHPQQVVFADARDERIFEAARYLLDNGLAHPVLLGGPVELRESAGEAGFHTRGVKVMHPLHNPDFETYVKEYIRLRRHRNITRAEAEDHMRLPLYHAMMMVRRADADLCIAGNESSTSELLRAGLRILGKDETARVVSGFVLLISPDKETVLCFADVAVIPEPSAAELAWIAGQTAGRFRELTNRMPKVAMLSFSTKGSAVNPLLDKVREAVTLLGSQEDLPVDGEIQFDAAFVPEIARNKCPGSPLKGEANVFIFPSLNAANIAYKIARDLVGYTAAGPLFHGFRYPLQGISRGAEVKEIIDTTLLASYMAYNGKQNNTSVVSKVI